MYCEQCGAELEQDARFCAMCRRQVEKDGGASAAAGLPKSFSDSRIGVLKKGVIPALLVVLGLGGVLFWMFRSGKVDVTDVAKSSNVVTKESKNELSRSKAEKMILEKMKFPKLVPVDLDARTSSTFSSYNDIYRPLESTGLIKLTMLRTGSADTAIELTEEGKKYLLNTDYHPGPGREVYQFSVKSCEIKFLRVPGIKRTGMDSAEVEYEWTFDNPTPFAHLMGAKGP